MAYEQTKDMFGKAAHALAVQPGRIHERLIDAFKELNRQMQVPLDLQEDLDELMAYTQVPQSPNGEVQRDLIETMTEEDACEVADELLALERALRGT